MCSINHDLKAIFIHVHKTGGTYISYMLHKYYGFKNYYLRRPEHDSFCFNKKKTTKYINYENRIHGVLNYYKTSKYINKKMGMNEQKWNSYYKFCFIRNPYDKIISAWNHVNRFNIPFDNYLNLTNTCNDVEYMHMFMPQVRNIINEKGKININYIGKFENLENDFQIILKNIGIKKIIHDVKKKLNKREHMNFYEYYNQDILNKVNFLLKEDFDNLKYEYINNIEEFRKKFIINNTEENHNEEINIEEINIEEINIEEIHNEEIHTEENHNEEIHTEENHNEEINIKEINIEEINIEEINIEEIHTEENNTGKNKININIFLLCYNEKVLLPHTVKHYKTLFPNCNITIYDNESTDNSVEIAKLLGCNVISWKSKLGNFIDDFKYIEIKNNCWKNIKDGWIIVGDMDEWLSITEEQLINEELNGTTILDTIGIDMIGESNTLDLHDINLHKINKGVINRYEHKKLCFLRNKINDINYLYGCHKCFPKGTINFSSRKYINKHMSILGLPYIINKSICI